MMNFWVNWSDCNCMTEKAMNEFRSEIAKELAEPEIRENYAFSQYVNENYEPMEILTKGLTEDVLKLAYEYHLSRIIEVRANEIVADEGWYHISLSD